MSSKATRAAVIGAALLAAPAWADDESAGVAPAAFRAEPASAVTVGAAHVTISKERIEVATELDAQRPGTMLRLDLPRFGWLGEAEPYPDRQFPELALAIDGHPAPTTDGFSAWVGTRDVTALVRAADIDPYLVVDTPPIVEPKGDPASVQALIAAKAITRAPEGLLAAWTVQRRIGVPLAVGRHVVTLRYKARPAFSLVSAPLRSGAVRWVDYCLTPSAAAGLMRRFGVSGAVIVRRYGISAGLDGARPPVVSLRTDVPPRGSLIATCSVNGKALVNFAGEQRVRKGPDGAIRILQIAPPPRG